MQPLKTTAELQAVHAQVRERVPYRPADHRLDRDIAGVAQLVESGALSAHLPTAPG
jgi:histidine ammonia-lyase